MTAVSNEWLVFVSHSGEDSWVARQIAREITARGARAFLDEADVDVGAEFEEDIRQFLDKADELLVLFTPWAFERPYFQAHPNAPVFLKKRDIIRLNEIDQYLDQLAARTTPSKTNG